MIAAARRFARRFAASPYDALRNPGTRRSVRADNRSEDWSVPAQDRDRLTNAVRTMTRNFAIADWAVRKHVQYTTRFVFKADTGDDGLDSQLEEYVARWSEPQNCDVGRRHSLPSLVRIAEGCNVNDGDLLVVKIAGRGPDRGRLQIIEGPRVRQPRPSREQPAAAARLKQELLAGRWVQGVKLSATGAAQAYAIHRRDGNKNSFVFERIVPASAAYHHGCFFRADQVRGISPVVSAINSFNDLYEGQTYALAGIKAAQLVGLVVKTGWQGNPIGAKNTSDTDGDGVADRVSRHKWGPRPQTIVIGREDDATMIDAKKPSVETAAFLEAMTYIAIKALDIPQTVYDESKANYSSMRAARIELEGAIRPKRDSVERMLTHLTRWRLGLAVFDGDLVLPAGREFADLKFRWRPVGLPLVDPQKEVAAAIQGLQMGLTNPYDAAAQAGGDYEENIAKTARAIRTAAAAGIMPAELAGMLQPEGTAA